MLRSRNGTEWNQNGIGRENKQHDLVQVPGSNTESGGPHAHRMHPKHDQNKTKNYHLKAKLLILI